MAHDALVIGGGMAGLAAAWRLAQAGYRTVLIEASDHLGGLASSFEKDGRLYPLGYHHILSTDAHLLSFLAQLGLLERVHWKRQRMGFYLDDKVHSLATPQDFLRFPLPVRTKIRMAARVATAWLPLAQDEPAGSWLSRVAGEAAVQDFFDPMTQIKFGLPTSALSAAWLRARTQSSEANCRYGYMPDADWVSVLVDALRDSLEMLGVDIRLSCRAEAMALNKAGDRVLGVNLTGGGSLRARATIGAVAAPILSRLTPDVDEPSIDQIAYTGVISTVIATRSPVSIDRYWTNILRPKSSFGGVFRLDLLNDSLGHPGVKLLNFCTHVRDRSDGAMLNWSEDEIEATYLKDYADLFGDRIEPEWTHTSRIPHYSPVFVHGYQNPAVRHPKLSNLFLAGNHRTFPVLATTGSAMGSGIEAARAAMNSRALKVGVIGDDEAA